MKKSFIIFCLLLLTIFGKSYSQPINMGFEGACGNPANAFFTGCFSDWTSACGTPDVQSNFAGVTPFEGSKYAHMYGMYRGLSCSGDPVTSNRTEGIILNHNFKQGYTYRISYAIQWKNSATGNCHTHSVNWLLTNGLANQTGTWQNCNNDGGATPAIPAGSQSVESFSLPSGNSGGWQVHTVDFTPTANFTQLVILNPVARKSNCAINSEAQGDIFLDGFSLSVICDPNDVPWFTYTANCNNGVYTVTATATDLDPQNHGWGLYQTDAPIADGGVQIAGGTGSSITFTITDYSKFYYIKHGIWGPCYDWREKRELVPLPQATDVNYTFVDAQNNPKTAFCYGEVIKMNVSGLSNYPSYYLDVWRRPINSQQNFDWYSGIGWTNAQPTSIDLTAAFGALNPPVNFDPGFEYEVKLAVSNAAKCITWTEIKRRFTVECCPGFFSAAFDLNPEPNPTQPTYALWAKNFKTYWPNTNATHEWYVFSRPANSGDPYTLINSVTSTSQTQVLLLSSAVFNVQYMVVHKIRTKCGDVCYVQYECANCPDAFTAAAANPYLIDCSVLDSMICAGKVPTNLKASCLAQSFSWSAVPGAIGYSIEVSFNDPACCASRYPNSGFLWNTLTTNSLPFSSLGRTPYDCIRWRVRAKCANGTFGPWSSYQCFYGCTEVVVVDGGGVAPTDGGVKRSVGVKALLEPVVSPNPSNGNMTLSLQAPGDLVMSIDVVNAQGNRIKTIARNTYKGGQFNTQMNLGAGAKGVYTVVFNTNYGMFRKKVIVQ